MIKFVGVIFILSGSFMCGHYFADRYLMRVYILEEFMQALQYIYSEIEYSVADMSEVFDMLEDRTKYLSEFFKSISDSLKVKDGSVFSEKWKKSCADENNLSFCTDEDRRVICELGGNLGNMDKYSQLHIIEIYQEKILQRVQDARSEYSTQARVCHVLGCTIGAFISVLLI